jgi:hypothetical protein
VKKESMPAQAVHTSDLVDPAKEIQPATALLSTDEVRSLTDVLLATLDAFASLMTGVGEVERRTGRRFSDIAKRMAGKEFIAQAVMVLTPEQMGLLLRILIRLSTLGDLSIDKLSPEEKLAKGEQLREISNDIRTFAKTVITETREAVV